MYTCIHVYMYTKGWDEKGGNTKDNNDRFKQITSNWNLGISFRPFVILPLFVLPRSGRAAKGSAAVCRQAGKRRIYNNNNNTTTNNNDNDDNQITR